MMRLTVAGCLCACLVAFPLRLASAAADPASATLDANAVEAWLSSYSASINNADLDALGKLWAEGADWAPPDAPQLGGRAAIVESSRAMFAKYTVSHRFTGQRFKLGGGFGVAVVAAAERYTPKAGGGVPWEQKTKGVVILRRDDDGLWRGTHFIWNRDAPATH